MNDLNTLMHASVDGARPDVDRLLAGAIRDGQRLQRRRRISYAGAGLAVAAIASAGAVAVGSLGGGTATELQPAASAGGAVLAGPALPASGTIANGAAFGLPSGLVAATQYEPGSTELEFVVPADATDADRAYLASHYPDMKIETLAPGAKLPNPLTAVAPSLTPLTGEDALKYVRNRHVESSPAGPANEAAPFRITLAGWSCGPAADEKFDCTGPAGAAAHVVWRPASSYADWSSGNPDKEAAWISTVHDGVFVTIDGDSATALGQSLTWK
jgi:hypothetical protein